MPRPATVTKEAMVNAGVELVREQGHEQLNARALAKRLGCSTQPILYQFATMGDLRRAVYAAADAWHSDYITSGLDEASDPLLQMGLNYVRFASEEPRLFRLLFQTDGLGEQNVAALVRDPSAAPFVQQVAAGTGLDQGAAQRVFLSLFVCAHGLASLLANNTLDYDERQVTRILASSLVGALAITEGEANEGS